MHTTKTRMMERDSTNETLTETEPRGETIQIEPYTKLKGHGGHIVTENKKTSIEAEPLHDKDTHSNTAILTKDGYARVNVHADDDSEGGDTIEDDDDDDDDLSVLPIDTGWAWVILAGATLEVFVYGGLMKSYGIFFVEFQKRFGSSASETNVMQTVHNIVVSIAGVFVTNIGLKYISTRTSIMIGGIGSFVSYLTSAFVTDIRIMSLTIGLMAGISNTMLFLPLVTTIGTYFKKHRGLANSVHVSGSSIGSLVFGPFYTALFDHYGYTGTMMIVSAILLNTLISGTLIRPVEFYKKRRKWKEMKRIKLNKTVDQDALNSVSRNAHDTTINSQTNSSLAMAHNQLRGENGGFHSNNQGKHIKECFSEKTYIQNGNELNEKGKLLRMFSETGTTPDKRNPDHHSLNKERPFLINRTVSHDPGRERVGAFPSPMLGRLRAKRNRTTSELSQSSILGSVLDSISRSKVALYASGDITCETMSLGQINALDNADGKDAKRKLDVTSTAQRGDKTCTQKTVHFLKTVFDLSVFGPVFVHFLCMAAVLLPSSVMMSVYIIPYAKEVGATSRDISIIFIVTSSVDLVSRISTGVIADRKYLKPKTIVAISSGILGVSCHMIRFVHEFWSLVVFAVIQGAFSGTYICLYNVILVEQLGLEKFKSSVGFVAMCHGVSIAVFFQLTGLLRDATGNFLYTYHLVGALLFIGSVLSFTLPLTSSYVENRKLSKKTDA